MARTDEEDQEAGGGIKVTDRRAFTREGERRETDEQQAESASPPDADLDAAATAEESWSADEAEIGPESIDFIAFVQSLYFSALMGLGEIENPETRLFTTNLDIARQDIDILTMLREKTRGNLTPSEDAFLQQVVPQLQILYVKKAG